MNGNIGFSYEIIRDYLLSEGGKVEYHKLIKHFKDALADPENKEARVLFKDLVNQVAVVTTEGNQKYLNIRQTAAASVDEPPKLPPRSNEQQYYDSRSSLNYQQSTVNPYYDAQPKLTNQQFTHLNQYSNTKLMNLQQQQYHNIQQANYPQQRLLPNMDPSIMNNQVANQQSKGYQISDSQPRQPFSYNLSQPMPAFLNQRIHPSEMNNLDMSNLIQPKPVPTIAQMPSLPNMMNPNLLMNMTSRYTNKNLTDQTQLPPLPNKTSTSTATSNTNQWSNPNTDCPPKAPPRRNKSFANGSNTYLNKRGTENHVKDNENFLHSIPKQFTDKIKEINELKFKSPGRVKEHAKKLNKMVSESELKLPMPLGLNNAANPNIQNNLKDDSDLNDQIKRRWMVKSSECDYNELQQMLKDYPKLAEFKDVSSGYNALHWAAKFNRPDIIKFIAGTYNVNPNIKTFSGYTPLHFAAMFGHKDIMDLLVKCYGADNSIRDYTGRTAGDLFKIATNKKTLDKLNENGIRPKQETETKSTGILSRTSSLRHTQKLLDRLPSKYRTMK